MKRFLPPFLILSICLCIGLLIAVFFKIEEVEEQRGYQGEARQNPYLAAQMFLNKMEIPTSELSIFSSGTELPNGVLILTHYRNTMTQTHAKKIKAWIEAGGHLIVRATSGEDILLDPLNITLAYGPDDEETAEDTDATSEAHSHTEEAVNGDFESEVLEEEHKHTETDQEESTPTTADETQTKEPTSKERHPLKKIELYWAEGEQPFSVRYSDMRLNSEEQHQRNLFWDQEGILLGISIPMESGRLTVVSDFQFMNNRAIGEEDNAAFLHYLIHQNRETPDQVLISLFESYPSIWTQLIKHQHALVLTLIMTLLFFFWAKMPRFGPLRPDPEPHSRSLMEHIAAASNFWWKRNRQEYLLAEARQAFFELLEGKHFQTKNMNQNQICKTLAEKTGITPEQIKQALYYPCQSGESFVRMMASLQKLRRTL